VRVRHNEKESQERILTKERGVFLVAKLKNQMQIKSYKFYAFNRKGLNKVALT
jgi:hypothetical protein